MSAAATAHELCFVVADSEGLDHVFKIKTADLERHVDPYWFKRVSSQQPYDLCKDGCDDPDVVGLFLGAMRESAPIKIDALVKALTPISVLSFWRLAGRFGFELGKEACSHWLRLTELWPWCPSVFTMLQESWDSRLMKTAVQRFLAIPLLERQHRVVTDAASSAKFLQALGKELAAEQKAANAGRFVKETKAAAAIPATATTTAVVVTGAPDKSVPAPDDPGRECRALFSLEGQTNQFGFSHGARRLVLIVKDK